MVLSFKESKQNSGMTKNVVKNRPSVCSVSQTNLHHIVTFRKYYYLTLLVIVQKASTNLRYCTVGYLYSTKTA